MQCCETVKEELVKILILESWECLFSRGHQITHFTCLNCPFHPSLSLLFCEYLLAKMALKVLVWEVQYLFCYCHVFIKKYVFYGGPQGAVVVDSADMTCR